MATNCMSEHWAAVKRGEAKAGCRLPKQHSLEVGAPCDQCTIDVLDMMAVHPDKGPWQVNVWDDTKVVLQSDDFRHDTALIVNGDFWDIEQKKAYAQLLADKLNKA